MQLYLPTKVLAHLIESYLNTNSNEMNRIYAREGLALWQQFKEALQKDEIKEKDYEKMMHASMIDPFDITEQELMGMGN